MAPASDLDELYVIARRVLLDAIEALRPDSLVSVSLVAALGMLMASACTADLVHAPTPICSKEDCDGDRVKLSGELPLSVDDPLFVAVTTCADDECITENASIGRRADYYQPQGNRWFATGACDRQRELDWCEPSTQWQVLVRFALSSADADVQPERFSVRIEDLDGEGVLLDRQWDAEFESVTPERCGKRIEDVSCLHFDATW
jgi:hypothetical protein